MTESILVVSDIHLGAVSSATEQAFRRFLSRVPEVASGLLINGDLFDFWFEYGTVVPRKHFRVLASLAEVVDRGVTVWFVGGNHDAWGGSFLREEVGLELMQGPVRIELLGRAALVAHGDGVGAGDLKYRALKTLLRSRAAIRAFRTLHPDAGAWVAERVSTTETKKDMADVAAQTRASYIRDWAIQQLEADPSLELVLAGHAHLPHLEEVGRGRFYVNSGDWIHRRSYARIDRDRAPELLEWQD